MPATAPNALDVRPLPGDRKLQTVLSTFDALEAGDSFVLVDDRDPATLCTRIEEKHPGEALWEYVKDGPHVWFVQVRRLPGST